MAETTLQQQIDSARSDIRTDNYSMSIGEWINLFQGSEIDIHPEFQRLFRWSEEQKSKLIESILLGIPIPPIFVSQREDGVWDVVDGLQRLSTIFEFVGILKDENGEFKPPLKLEPTKYLPATGGKYWQKDEDEANSFSIQQRLLIKRTKLDVSIILRESDKLTKYELFQRLNTGGSPLSPQEVRNAILIMVNRDFYRFIHDLSLYPSFKETVSLSDRAAEEQYDLDLILRFIILRKLSPGDLQKIGDLNDFVTEKMVSHAENDDFDFAEEKATFEATFDLLNDTIGSDSMKKYNREKGRFLGGFLVSAFEVVALGIAYNIDKTDIIKEEIENIVKDLWHNHSFTSSSGSGVRASSRIPKTVIVGRELFDIAIAGQ